MKKMIAFVLVVVCVISLAACSNKKGQDYLNAKVLEMTETELLVECVDESSDQLTGTPISVSKNVISADGIPEIEEGDEIRVVFDFDSVDKKSNPVRIASVYAIYLLDEDGAVIPG